jgi:hypothetical protein
MQPDPIQSIQSIQSVLVAIALGSLVAAWAFQHFHAPDRTEDIRFSVPQQRYFVAVGIHVSIILAVYAVLVLVLYPLVLWASKGTGLTGCWRCIGNQPSCPDNCKDLRLLQPASLVWAALVSALFIRIVVPNAAITRHIVDRLRSQTHDLALFPFAREILVAALSLYRGASIILVKCSPPEAMARDATSLRISRDRSVACGQHRHAADPESYRTAVARQAGDGLTGESDHGAWLSAGRQPGTVARPS